MTTSPNIGATQPQRGVTYSLRGTPLLKSGVTNTSMAQAENLWVHGKVYSGGGENTLHSHAEEDHTFFILQGQAMFEFGDGSREAVGVYDGVLVPKGVLYRFEASADDNLVMLRVGGAQRREDWSGQFLHGMPIELTGKFGGKDGAIIEGGRSQAKGKTPSEPVVFLYDQIFGS